MRNGIILDTLASVDIVEVVKCEGVVLEIYEGFFCHNLEYNAYTEIVTISLKKYLVIPPGKYLLQKPF